MVNMREEEVKYAGWLLSGKQPYIGEKDCSPTIAIWECGEKSPGTQRDTYNKKTVNRKKIRAL